MQFVPEDILKREGISETEARLELACRLFQIGRLSLWPAAQLAGLTRVQMEDELFKRGIGAYGTTMEEYERDLASLDKILGPVKREPDRQ